MTGGSGRDMIVLTADIDIENVIRGLLARPRSLKIREPVFDVERHPGRDGGCRTRASGQLRPFRETHRYALVVFDRRGCGSDGSREEIQSEVERRLARDGWEERSKAIVVDPEIEAWVWSGSPHVSEVLGWTGGYADLRNWLKDRGLWSEGSPKPSEPKRAVREAMQRAHSIRSPRIFSRLAETVSLRGCEDPAFEELGRTLRRWFPAR